MPGGRFLRVALWCLGVLGGFAQTGHSAIVLSIAPSATGSIPIGDSIDFIVSVRSNSGDTNNLAMLGFTLSVTTGGGRFVSGSGIHTPGSHLFFGPPPSNSLPSTLVGYSYSASSGQFVSGTTPSAFASFRVNTTQASAGDYTISISAADAADISFNSIGVVTPAPLGFRLVVVPEPSSMLLIPVGLVFCFRRTRSRHNSAKS